MPRKYAVLVALQIVTILVAAYMGATVGHLDARITSQQFALCQALNDARSRAFSSLANDPAAQAREVGKINRTMARLDCADRGFPEVFEP